MQYALVTGAAKGIGKGIATALAKRQYNLLLVDLDSSSLSLTQKELSFLYKVDVQTLHLDLTDPGAIDVLWNWTSPLPGELSIVVNNAGYGLNGNFESIAIEDQINLVNLNIKTGLQIAHRYIPLLRCLPKAFLLNVGSTTSYQSVPYLSVYAASKSFVLSFTRSLRYELRGSNISVSCLSPGSTDTHFVIRAGMSARTRRLAKRFNMQPAEVGEIAVKGLLTGKAEIVPGFSNKLHAWLPKFFPKRFVEKIAGNIYENIPENEAARPILKQHQPALH